MPGSHAREAGPGYRHGRRSDRSTPRGRADRSSQKINKFKSWKDGDGGDRDQNEENDTQKDGGKEKMEGGVMSERQQGRPVVPGPAVSPAGQPHSVLQENPWLSLRLTEL